MGATELRAELLGLLAELEDSAAAVGLAVELHAGDLAEERLAGLLAGAHATLDRLRSLPALLQIEDGPEGSAAAADLP
jgi:hypothetical protein